MESHNTPRKRIRIVATGGTIASKAAGRVATEGYKPSVIPVEELVAHIPELDELAEVTCEQIFLKPSSAISDSDLFDLSQRVNELLAGDYDGVVITHGTDTMEETAFFLNLTVKSEKPVVITGSMRPSEVISSDGELNLYEAVCCAASDKSVGMGVVIVMNDLIISARDAVKFSTFKTDAYQAPFYGILGTVRNGAVDYSYKPVKAHTARSRFAGMRAELPKAEILYIHQGCTDLLFDACLKAGCKGIVTAGVGNGGTTMHIMELYREADEKGESDLPILVRSSRVATGGVSESERSGSRSVASGDLSPHKALILLRFALAVTEDVAEIKEIFAQY